MTQDQKATYIKNKTKAIDDLLDKQKVVIVRTFSHLADETSMIEFILMPDVAKALKKKKRHVVIKKRNGDPAVQYQFI